MPPLLHLLREKLLLGRRHVLLEYVDQALRCLHVLLLVIVEILLHQLLVECRIDEWEPSGGKDKHSTHCAKARNA